MHVRDLDTVPPDQIGNGYSARDIVVLIGVLCQGEIMGLYGGIHPWLDVERQKTIATTHHDQVIDGEAACDTVVLVGVLHLGDIAMRKGIFR